MQSARSQVLTDTYSNSNNNLAGEQCQPFQGVPTAGQIISDCVCKLHTAASPGHSDTRRMARVIGSHLRRDRACRDEWKDRSVVA